MSNPATSSILRAAEAARRLSAIALWFAALFGRILPGARRWSEQAEAWLYIDATMTRFAELLERLAAGEIEPPAPHARPDSLRSPKSPRAPTPSRNVRASRAPRPILPKRATPPATRPRAPRPHPTPENRAKPAHPTPAKPMNSKNRPHAPSFRTPMSLRINKEKPTLPESPQSQTDKSFLLLFFQKRSASFLPPSPRFDNPEPGVFLARTKRCAASRGAGGNA